MDISSIAAKDSKDGTSANRHQMNGRNRGHNVIYAQYCKSYHQCSCGGTRRNFTWHLTVKNMEQYMTQLSEYEFRTQPWFDEDNFPGFDSAIPLKTIVVHCFDPRAAEIPQAIAAHFPDEVYPGENILDEAGNRVGHTRTMFVASNAGGRALSALQSVATMEYLFNIQNVIVVHHSFCGATSFRSEQLVEHFHEHHHVDIASLIEKDSRAITHYEESIKHDVQLLRNSPAVPKNINLYGFFYEINSGTLTEITKDIPA